MKAFITGITGQDGSYLAELLLSKGYKVFGMVRRHSGNNEYGWIENILNNVNLVLGDMTDPSSLDTILSDIQPDEIYNLASQSNVRASEDIPYFTAQTNAMAVVNLLSSIRKHCPNAKLFQAGSSEMFGFCHEIDNFQRETTEMKPVSPYGISKLFSYHMCSHYRKAYGLFICNGIMFNHESPRRGLDFVSSKVVKTAVDIKNGKTDYLFMGDIDVVKDWGHSKDYVTAMWMMLNHNTPDDFIISTMVPHSVREMISYVFAKLELDYTKYIKKDEKYLRKEQVKFICGNSNKIRSTLEWESTYTFESMLDEMIDYWQAQN